MTKRVAIYARVSTDGQSTNNQLRVLKRVAKAAGWDVVDKYIDEALSGAKGRDERPQFDALHQAITRREVDMVMAWSVDRIGRSLQHLVQFLEHLQSTKVDLYLHEQGIDTTTPAGRAMFQMCGVFAEFERSMIQARVKAGLERAKASGKTLGRPKTPPHIERRVQRLLRDKVGKKSIARQLGIGVSVVQRIAAVAAD